MMKSRRSLRLFASRSAASERARAAGLDPRALWRSADDALTRQLAAEQARWAAKAEEERKMRDEAVAEVVAELA